MVMKTITVDERAYEMLVSARRRPSESFSEVIHRTLPQNRPKTAAALLEASKDRPLISEEILDRLDRNQAEDTPPDDPWHD